MDTAFEAARQICDFEMASIALFDKERKRHRVWRVKLAADAAEIVDPKALDGLEFGEGAWLTAMVVKNKHYLPAGGELRDQSIPLFSRRVKPSSSPSSRTSLPRHASGSMWSKRTPSGASSCATSRFADHGSFAAGPR